MTNNRLHKLPSDCLKIIFEYADNEKTNFKEVTAFIPLYQTIKKLEGGNPKFKISAREKVSKLFEEEIYFYFNVSGKRFMFVKNFEKLELLGLYANPFENLTARAAGRYLKTEFLNDYDDYTEELLLSCGGTFKASGLGEELINKAFETKDLKLFYNVFSVKRFLLFALCQEQLTNSEKLFFEDCARVSNGFLLHDKHHERELKQTDFKGGHYYEEKGKQKGDFYESPEERFYNQQGHDDSDEEEDEETDEEEDEETDEEED